MSGWLAGLRRTHRINIPYEYFHYFVTNRVVTNALGAAYQRFSLVKDRMIFAVADDKAGLYALDPKDTRWWLKAKNIPGNFWDRQVLADNVVRFDVYVQGWDGKDWMEEEGGERIFDSTLGPKKIADGAKYSGDGADESGDGADGPGNDGAGIGGLFWARGAYCGRGAVQSSH